MSQITRFLGVGAVPETLTGNVGGAVGPTGGNIDVVGTGAIVTTGNPATSTLTISIGGTHADTYTCDVGSATPALSVLNVLGGTNINTAGAGNTVTINLDAAITVDSVTTSPVAANVQLSGTSLQAGGTSADVRLTMLGQGVAGTYTDLFKVNYNFPDNNITFATATVTSSAILSDGGILNRVACILHAINNTASDGAELIGARSRDAGALTPAIVNNNDTLFALDVVGFDGLDYALAGQLTCSVDGAAAAGDMPGRWEFRVTPSGTEVPVLALSIGQDRALDATGTVTFSNYTANSMMTFGVGGLVTATALTNGQLMIGSTGVAPVAATLTAGAGITVTNAAGSITIAANNSGMEWTVLVAGTTAADNQGYFCNGGALVDVALPAASVVGDTFEVVAMNATGWRITQGAGQQIQIGNVATTAGAGGSLASTAIGDAVTLVVSVVNTNWIVTKVQGNITVV